MDNGLHFLEISFFVGWLLWNNFNLIFLAHDSCSVLAITGKRLMMEEMTPGVAVLIGFSLVKHNLKEKGLF